MKDECIAIVNNIFGPEETLSPFGKRWVGERFWLTAQPLEAPQAAKTFALDVMGEYVPFFALEKPAHGE